MAEVLQDIINQVEKLEFKTDDVIIIKTSVGHKEFKALRNSLQHLNKTFKNKVIVMPKDFEISVFNKEQLIDFLNTKAV